MNNIRSCFYKSNASFNCLPSFYTAFHLGSDEVITKQVHQMEAGLNKVKTEIERHKKPQDSGDKFAARMNVSLIRLCLL